jgi:hypothetical protein
MLLIFSMCSHVDGWLNAQLWLSPVMGRAPTPRSCAWTSKQGGTTRTDLKLRPEEWLLFRLHYIYVSTPGRNITTFELEDLYIHHTHIHTKTQFLVSA